MYVIKSKWGAFSSAFAFAFSYAPLKNCIGFALAKGVGKMTVIH